MKFDFKNKKTIIAASTLAVVILGVFVGVKVMLKSSVSNALKVNSTNGNQEQSTKDDKVIADSLKQKTDEGSGKSDSKSTGVDADKDNSKKSQSDDKNNKELQSSDKKNNNDKDKTTTSASDSSDKGVSKNNSSDNKSIKDVKVYDDQYIVKKGDTLYTIARKFFVEKELLEGIDLIKKINTLSNADLIKEGGKLYIPIGKNFDKKVNETTAKNYKSYIVKKGDTLIAIAKEEMEWCDSSTGVRLLREANNIVNDIIKENQRLIIPAKDAEKN